MNLWNLLVHSSEVSDLGYEGEFDIDFLYWLFSFLFVPLRSSVTGAGQPGRDSCTYRLQWKGLRFSTQCFPGSASSHTTRCKSFSLLIFFGKLNSYHNSPFSVAAHLWEMQEVIHHRFITKIKYLIYGTNAIEPNKSQWKKLSIYVYL